MITQIKLQGDSAQDAHILFIPNKTIECEELLQESGFYFEDRIKSFQLDLLLLEDDLLSMELPENFLHYTLQDDDAYKVMVQKSINRIEKTSGLIKYKYAKGNVSAQIINRLKSDQQRASSEQANVVSFDAEFDCLIMLDRNIDMVSPFCIQQVYEGMLDETFGIKTTMINVETKILNSKVEEGKSDYTELFLNNEDFLFKDIRGMSLSGIGAETRKQMKEITEVMKEKDNPTNITELSKYVNKVKSMNIAKRKELLDYHINMASYIRTT